LAPSPSPQSAADRWTAARSSETTRDGFFTVNPKELPATFLVKVTGGRVGKTPLHGTLMTAVQGYRGVTPIGVSGATTLVAAYALTHPTKSLLGASDHATTSLGLPPGYGNGAGLSFDQLNFSESALVARAAAAGGIDAYVSGVVRQIDQNKRVASFAQRKLGSIGGILAGISAVIKIYKFTKCSIERKTVELGCVVEAFDGKEADTKAMLEALAGIHDQLVGVSNQITELQTQLTASIDALGNSTLQTQWNNVINSFQQSFYGPIGAAYTFLMAATDTSYTARDRELAAAAAKSTIQSLSQTDADVSMAKTLLPQAGATGALAQFSDLVRAQSGQFFASSWSPYYNGGYADLIQQEWQFFEAWQSKLEYVLIEGANASGHSKSFVDEQIIQPYLGLPVAEDQGGQFVPVPLSKKRHVPCSEKPVRSTGESCLGYLDQELEAVGLPLPRGVVIDPKSGMMWAQEVFNYYQDTGLDNIGPRGSLSWANGVVKDIYNGGYSDWGGFNNWRMPTEAQLKALFAGNTDPPGLRDKLSSSGGFFNNPPDRGSHQSLEQFGGSQPYVWTSSTSGGKPVSGYLPTGAIGPSSGGLASVIVVRELSPCERYYYDTSKSAPPLC
jgi:hypothetical protein